MEAEVERGAFLEHADVHGNMYGTSLAAVARVCEQGKVPILDIDVQGAAKVRGRKNYSRTGTEAKGGVSKVWG